MNCENNMCVYWNENKCMLEEISIDISGSCQDCIYVDIDEKILKAERKKFLNEHNNPN